MNLSVVQLLQKNVVENIKRILDKTGVNPKNIVLEITESFAINDMQRVMDIITGLKKLGPRIALDDFGTGYSSLNYIKQLPLDIIKVDKTFIDDIVEDDYASITSSACDSSIFSSIAAINPSLISTSITLSVLLAGSSTLPSLISMFIRPISPLSFSLQKYWLVQAFQNNIPVYNPRQDF